MRSKAFLKRLLFWFTAGGAVGSYLPWTQAGHYAVSLIHKGLAVYPAWFHWPLIAFLFVVLLPRFANLLKRYSENWKAKNPPFTPIEATVLFVFGGAGALFLGGSIPRHLHEYPHDVWLAIVT